MNAEKLKKLQSQVRIGGKGKGRDFFLWVRLRFFLRRPYFLNIDDVESLHKLLATGAEDFLTVGHSLASYRLIVKNWNMCN
jgi:hypothetical protein